MYEIEVRLDGVIQWTIHLNERMSESDYVELTQTKHAYLGREYSLFGIPLHRGKGFFLGDMELVPQTEPSNDSVMTVTHKALPTNS